MRFAIAGAGKLGIKIMEALLSGDHSVMIIDTKEDVLNKLMSQVDVMTLNANAKEIKVLKSIDIDTFDFLIASTGSDEQNILIASFAKKLGCPKVIASVRDPEHMNQREYIQETMDIDYIVNPDYSIASEIYKYLVEKYTLNNGIFTNDKVALVEFAAKRIPRLIDLQLTDFSSVLPNMVVVAISSEFGKIVIPHGDTVIKEDDVLYVIGEPDPITKLHDTVVDRGSKYTDISKIIIMGGGKTGLYLAQMLEKFGNDVKIVEQDMKRCHYLSAHLENSLILNADATDLTLWDEENIDNMDAFISLTGFDEENLLLALTAKKRGIEDVIAKISRQSYVDLIETMGIDMALNPLDITASNILRFVQGSKRVLSSVIVQGQAELIEIIADEKMPMVGKPLKNLDLPKDMIVAAVHKGTKVIIPNGDTVIKNGDHIVILYLLTAIKDLEKMVKTTSNRFFSFR